MKFLSMVRVAETGQQPSERLMQEMGKLMEEMTRAGVLVSTAGLRPSKEGVRMRSNHGKISVTDGPFTETKELVASYAVLEVKSMAEAVDWTTRFLKVLGQGECELRPIFEAPGDSAGGHPCEGPQAARI